MQTFLEYYAMDRFTPLCFMKSSRTARIDITRRVQNHGSVGRELKSDERRENSAHAAPFNNIFVSLLLIF